MKLSSIYKQLSIALLLISTPLSATEIINTPGKYTITTDQEYDPTDPNTPFFQITVDDVTLEMQGSILRQANTNTQPGTDAIVVDPNLKNIIITKGILRNFSGSGIKVGDGCQNIHINEINIHNCDAGGIMLEGETTGTGIANGTINSCFVTSCTGVDGNSAIGLHMKACSGFTISNAEFSYHDAQTVASGFGILLESCTECLYTNIITSNNGGTGASAGIAVSESTNCHFQDVESHYNVSHDSTLSGSLSGFLVDQSTNIECDNCRSRYNSNAVGTCYGFYAHDGEFNFFNDCIAEFNSGTAKAAGFTFSNETKSSINQSKSKKNDASGESSNAYGIWLNGTSNDACIIDGNIVTNHTSGSTSYGIRDDRNPSTNLITRNYAFNHTTNYSVTYPMLVSLPVLSCRISTMPGLPSNSGGIIDNISVVP
jgi:hypothetical protein